MTGTCTCVDSLQRDILEDAYAQVEKLIYRICWKFKERYGGDFHEWLSEANVIFMDAVASHNGKSSLVTWLYYQLHWGLYDVLRKKSREQKNNHMVSFEDMARNEISPEDLFAATQSNSITSLIQHVGESGRELWELILDPPKELQDELDETDPECSWDAIQRHLEWNMRWTWKQMQTAIAELREICTE